MSWKKRKPLISVKQTIQGLLELVFPPTCQLCSLGLPAGLREFFCVNCLRQLRQLLLPQCPRCAASFPGISQLATNCPHCQNEDYSFDRVIAWGTYTEELQHIILRMKQQEQEQLAHHAGTLLAQQYRETLAAIAIDEVIPVPLHWTRRLWRGYNQSLTMALAIGQVLQVPCQTNWLFRKLSTPMQASVTPTQRRRNLQQAMVARLPGSAKGKHILLVDDVVTTGATADACSRALLTAGAGRVTVLALARAVG